MLTKSSILFFLFGGIVTACLFSTVSKIWPVLLESRLRTISTLPGIESLKKFDIGFGNGVGYKIRSIEDGNRGETLWPITVNERHLLRPGMQPSP